MRPRRAGRKTTLLDGLFASLLGLALGIMGGTLLAERRGGAFATPEGLDRSAWNIVSPGLDQKVADPEIGRGTHILDGALVLRKHAFFRADVITVADTRPVGRVLIELAPNSGEVRLVLRGDGADRPTFVRICPTGWSMGPKGSACTPHPPGPIELHIAEGRGTIISGPKQIPMGNVTPGQVELTTEGEEARIARLAYYDTDGKPIVEEDFASRGPGEGVLWAGAGIGGLLGAALGWLLSQAAGGGQAVVRGRASLLVVLWLLPPLLVLSLGASQWLLLAERLYLVKMSAWVLARWGLGLSLLPFGAALLLRSGLLAPRSGEGVRRGELLAWLMVSLATAFFGLRWLGGEWSGLWPGALGLLFLLSPLRLIWAARLDGRRALLQDLPAHVAIGLLGWGGGLLPAAFWRVLSLLSGTRLYADRGAGPATDQLVLLGLVLVLGLETAARSSFLDRAWDSTRLSTDLAPTVSWRDPEPFWQDRCGGDAQAEKDAQVGVIYVGGSSTGGAYQFIGEPDAFFPTLVHKQLCASLPAGRSLITTNFGDGGRDSFTVSRSVQNLLKRAPARLIVAYIGVNDMLGSNNTRTRKERETEMAGQAEATRGLAGLGAHSRVITGIGLLTHPLQDTDRPTVADVPLPDAEENLRRIATEAAAQGARVLLLTELVAGELSAQLNPYAALQARLATELDNVDYFDLRTALGAQLDQELLVDRNHLSRVGSAQVAAVLVPEVARQLNWTAPVTAPPATDPVAP